MIIEHYIPKDKIMPFFDFQITNGRYREKSKL